MSSLQNRQFRDNIKGIGYDVPPKEESQQLDESKLTLQEQKDPEMLMKMMKMMQGGMMNAGTEYPTDNQLTEDEAFRRSIKVWGEIWAGLGAIIDGWMEKYPPEGETPDNITPQTPGSKPKGKGSGQSIPGGPQA